MQQDVLSRPFANYQLWLTSQWCTEWVMERSLWIFCVSSLCSGSSLHADLRGPSIPSSPSCTPNTHTVLCSGNSEPNLNTTLNINLNSSLNSNYHAVFSSSTGLFECHRLLSSLSIDHRVIILFSNHKVVLFMKMINMQPAAHRSSAEVGSNEVWILCYCTLVDFFYTSVCTFDSFYF